MITYLIIFMFYVLLFVVLYSYARIKGFQLTKKHQKEWDEIKSNLPKVVIVTTNICRDYSDCELMAMKADAYLKYVSSLKSHWLVGCCLPRM